MKAVVLKYKKIIREDNLDNNTIRDYMRDSGIYKDERRKYIHKKVIKLVRRKIRRLNTEIINLNSSISIIYPQSRKYLINKLGPYCSYCGMYVRANLAVEHMLPKSIFPNKSVDWDNFLLACTNCNSLKGSKPANDAGNTQQEVLDLYAWPDRDAMHYEYSVRNVSGLRFQKETYKVIDDETGDERSITTKTKDVSAAAIDLNITTAWIGEVFGNPEFTFIHHSGDIYVYMTKKRNTVKRIALSLSASNQGVAKHSNTIDLCKLNKYIVEVDVTDRRVPCRTIVFLRVCSAIKDLDTLTNAPNNADQLMNILVCSNERYHADYRVLDRMVLDP